MATRKNEVPVVETALESAEMTETTTNEVPSENTSETSLTPTNSWDDIKPTLEKCEVSDLREVIAYCEGLIEELQKDEVDALEEQMRAIQEKLMAMKGKKVPEKKSKSWSVNPIVNPNNPKDVYKAGPIPSWLKDLTETTGKTVSELRESM